LLNLNYLEARTSINHTVESVDDQDDEDSEQHEKTDTVSL